VYVADGFGGRVVKLDNVNNIVAIYINRTGYGVAITSKCNVLVVPGGGYSFAVMAKPEQSVVKALSS
jgi:hypothetical protein